MRTSYSALETFHQCPQKYKFQEIDKIKTPKSKEAVFGTLIHASLKYMFSPNPLFPSLDEIIAHFRQGWNAAEVAELSTEERSMYLSQGEAIMRKLYAKNPPWNYSVVDLESRFEIIVEDPKTGEAHVLAGIMDRIDKPRDDAYEIIDYKTSRKMKSQEAVDQDLQLSVYHLGLTRRWPHIDPARISLSLYYVKHNEKLSTARTSEQTEATRERILAAIREIGQRSATNDFPPQPSALCDWCGYKSICPAWKFLYQNQESEIKNQEEIQKDIEELCTLKRQGTDAAKRILELQKNIKEYMNAENLTRVFGDGGMISKTAQERYQYDFEKIKQALVAQNRMDVWEALLAPDEKKLKKMITALPSPLQEIVEEARIQTRKFEVLTVSLKKQKVAIDELEAVEET